MHKEITGDVPVACYGDVLIPAAALSIASVSLFIVLIKAVDDGSHGKANYGPFGSLSIVARMMTLNLGFVVGPPISAKTWTRLLFGHEKSNLYLAFEQ